MFAFKLDPSLDKSSLRRRYIFRTTLEGIVVLPLLIFLFDWVFLKPEDFLSLPYIGRIFFIGVFSGIIFGIINFPFAYRHMKSLQSKIITLD